jgi:spermidine synthase
MTHTTIDYQFVQTFPAEPLVELYQLGGWWRELPRAREKLPALIRGSFCFLVALEGEKLIGMGRALSDGVSDAYIQDVIVHPEYRGRGIGLEIVRRLKDYCIEQELGWIGLVAENGTVPFYKRLGFMEIPEDTFMLIEV